MLPMLLTPRSWGTESLDRVQRDLDRVFARFGNDVGSETDLTAEYPVDIREDDKCIMVDAEMPGFKKEEISVKLENGILSISAEHKEEQKSKGGKQHLRERKYRRIERSFTLPNAVDDAKVDARLADGVLHLTLNKAQAALPRKITVQ